MRWLVIFGLIFLMTFSTFAQAPVRRTAAPSLPQLREAVKRNPKNAELRYALGLGLGRIGQFNEAIAELRQAVILNNDFVEAWMTLGMALQQKGELKTAADAINRAGSLRPNDPAIWLSLANLYQQSQNFPRAVEAMRRAVELQPKNAEFQSQLGMLLDAAGARSAVVPRLLRAHDVPALRRGAHAGEVGRRGRGGRPRRPVLGNNRGRVRARQDARGPR